MNTGNPISQNTPNSFNQSLGISGKYVNDFSEITASDVPMGGQPSIFIRNDRSEMQMREWSPNGQIVTTLYKPCLDVQEVKQDVQPIFDAKTEVLEPILERISALEEKLDKLNKPVAVPKGATK